MEEGTSASLEAGNNEIPELQRWTKDLNGLPTFTYELLTKHLSIENAAVGSQKHKKLGYQMFKDKYIGKVEVKANVVKGKMSCFLVKGCVNAAMKSNTYTVYVHLNQANGEVVYSNCTCAAGKGGRCKHIVALLFQIIEYKQLDLTEIPDHLTCTQLLQQWHVPRKDESDEPVLYENISFNKAIYEKDAQGKKRKNSFRDLEFDPTPEFARTIKKNDIKKLSDSLNSSDPNNYLGKLLESNECQPVHFSSVHEDLPSKKRHTESMNLNINDSSVRGNILKNLKPTIQEHSFDSVTSQLHSSIKITQAEVLEIEKNTREQSSSDQWFNERQKRLTSSNFGAVVKRRKSIYPKSLIAKIKNSSKNSNCPKQCQWRKDKEKNAVVEYFKRKQNCGENVNVCSTCGFVVNLDLPWLGASPDFLVYDPTEASSFGIGEVKCPFSKKDVTIEEASKDKQFFLQNVHGKIQLKKTHNFFYQIQGCMASLNVCWCDFVVFTNVDLFIERIYFDKDFWLNIVPELSSFYTDYMLPEP